VVVKDPATKAKLVDCLNRGNPSTEAIKSAPVVIVACAELKKSGYYKGEVSTDRGDWFMFDVGIAMENLALAAHALGLGTVHVGLIPDSKKLDALLGLPENVTAVEMTPLGYPAAEGKAPPRKELSELVSYEKYGNH
jgi:nitroreductase